MWKKRYPTIQKRREFLKTPDGKAISYIQRLCKEVIDVSSLDSSEKTRCKGALFGEGAYIYTYVRRIEKAHSEVKQTVTLRLKAAESIQSMEIAQAQWKKLSDIREQARAEAGFLAEENWGKLIVSSERLIRKFKNTLRVLKGIECDLDDIRNQGVGRVRLSGKYPVSWIGG
jgi:hypothetical protein